MAITYDSARTGFAHDEDESRLATLESQNLNSRITTLENTIQTLQTTISNQQILINQQQNLITRFDNVTFTKANGTSIFSENWSFKKWNNVVMGSGGIVKPASTEAGWHTLGYVNIHPTTNVHVPYIDTWSGWVTGILQIQYSGEIRFFTNTARNTQMNIYFTACYYC